MLPTLRPFRYIRKYTKILPRRIIYSLLPTSVGMFYPNKTFRIKLPQAIPTDFYVSTAADIKKIIEYSKDDLDMTIAIYLAAFGTFRMQRGGWSSDHTLKKIYRGSMDDYQQKFSDLTNEHFSNMQHKK